MAAWPVARRRPGHEETSTPRISRERLPNSSLHQGRLSSSPAGTSPQQEACRPRLAWPASPLDLPLHPDFCILAQCRRNLLRQAHTAPQARHLPIRQRSEGRHQPFRRRDQRQSKTLRLETSVRVGRLSCSPFQVSGTKISCSLSSLSEWPQLSRAGGAGGVRPRTENSSRRGGNVRR